MQTHEQSIQVQFDSRAEEYLHSPVHAQGPDLAYANELVSQAALGTKQALDVGCGAGHLSFALAASFARVVALDPSPHMLATVAREAAERHLTHIETRLGTAESLPFADGSFDLVGTRYSAHHWTRFEPAMEQMHRALRPGGYLLVSDVLGPEDALVDTHLQTIELLRDPSHVRNRSKAEWLSILERNGFSEIVHRQWTTRIAFSLWVERMRTPADRVSMIRALQTNAPEEVQHALAFEIDGSFSVQTGLFWARRPT